MTSLPHPADDDLGPTNLDLAPFDWDVSPADFHLDHLANCGAAIVVAQVSCPDAEYAYDVSVLNRNPDTVDEQAGHDLTPLHVHCHRRVDEQTGTHRLAYITGEDVVDVAQVRGAAQDLLARVAQHHTAGYCVWGTPAIPEWLYP